MDPITRRFLLWLSWQLAVFGAYAFYRTRRPVGAAIALAQIVTSTLLGSVLWLLSFQFAPPIAPLVVAAAIGWGLAGGAMDSARRKHALADWLLGWVLAGTLLSVAANLVFPPVEGSWTRWFVVNARFK
jgi:hypothetical protein